MREKVDHQFNFRAATVSAGIKMNPDQQGLISGAMWEIAVIFRLLRKYTIFYGKSRTHYRSVEPRHLYYT
jgi:hypothetical protein